MRFEAYNNVTGEWIMVEYKRSIHGPWLITLCQFSQLNHEIGMMIVSLKQIPVLYLHLKGPLLPKIYFHCYTFNWISMCFHFLAFLCQNVPMCCCLC